MHGANCECVFDELHITEVGHTCQDFYTAKSTLKVPHRHLSHLPIKLFQGKLGKELGEGVFAGKNFVIDEPLSLFAFGKLTSRAAYEVISYYCPHLDTKQIPHLQEHVAKERQYPFFPGVFALQRVGWLLVLDEWSPGAKINSFQDTGKKQNVLFNERFLQQQKNIFVYLVLSFYSGRTT